MGELKEKIYFADRWYYLSKSDGDIATYSSKINDKNNNTILEVDTNTKSLNLIFIKNKKTMGKLSISDITKQPISYNYEQFIPETIEVDNNLYTNLLTDFSVVVDNCRVVESSIIFHRMKKMNKMCYCEPTFPLDAKLDPRVFDLNCSAYESFKNAYSLSPQYFNVIIDTFFRKHDEIENVDTEVIDDSCISELVVPSEMFLYDRNYHLVNSDVTTHTYIDDGKTSSVEIITDLNELKVKRIEFRKEDGNRNIIQIYPDSSNDDKVTIRYVNKKKFTLALNGVYLEHAKVHSQAYFGKDKKLESFAVEINAGIGKNYLLQQHPYFTNTFCDTDGNSYNVRCAGFAEFLMMLYYAPGIYNSMQDKMFPKVKKID